jgi:hypothetical protein
MIFDNEELTIVENELLHTLETYYFLYDIDKIPEPIPEKLDVLQLDQDSPSQLIQLY